MTLPFRIFVELFLAAVFIVAIATGGLLLRVSAKPLHLDKYAGELQTLMSGVTPNLNFQVNSAMLANGKSDEIFELVFQDVTLSNRDNEKIGSIQSMVLGFSWRNLLLLNATPSTIQVVGPSIQIARFEDGHFGFNTVKNPNRTKHSINELEQFFADAPDAFKEISIKDAWIQFEDRTSPLKMEAKNGNMMLLRNGHEMNGTLKVDLFADDFHQTLKGSVLYDPAQHLTRVTMGIKNVAITELSKVLSQIPKEAALSTPLSAMAEVTINRNFQPLTFVLDLKGEKGELTLPPYFPQAIALDSLHLRSIYDVPNDSLTVEKLRLTMGNGEADIQGKVSHLRDATKDKTFAARGQVKNLPINTLSQYWPHEVGHNARDWVVNNMHEGIADLATLEMDGTLTADKHFKLGKLDGQISFHGTTVEYFKPMEPVKNVVGIATYGPDFFNIKTSAGDILDTKVTSGDIRISGMQAVDQHINILLNLDGPLKDTLQVISAKPLEYLQKMGKTPGQFSGSAKSTLYLGFPLMHSLTLQQVNMRAASLLEDVTIKNIVRDVTATAKKLALKVDSNGMAINGKMKLEDADTYVAWQEFFDEKNKVATDVHVKGAITGRLLKALRIPFENITGAATGEARIIQDRNKDVAVSLTADAKQAALNLPALAIAKPAGMPAQIAMDVAFEENGPTTISNASATWQGMDVQQAMARWSKAGNLESATLKNIRMERTRASLIIAPDGANRIRVVMNGPVIDLSGFWAQHDTTPPETNPPIYDVSLRADKLFLDPTIPLTKAQVNIVKKGDAVLTMNVQASVEDAVLTAKQTQQPNGIRSLVVNSTNSGKILQALDITDTVRGGTLALSAQSTAAKPSQLDGRMTLSKFSMIKAPVLAQLINALSPGGLLELLNNKGLNFDTLESKIGLEDNGIIHLSKGRLTGTSLGMSFYGRVLRRDDTVNLKGTLVPIEGLNKMVGKIPLIGPILTGLQGEGILAATYSIKGPTDNPNVTVNPLSALAPGILRSIFFESGRED